MRFTKKRIIQSYFGVAFFFDQKGLMAGLGLQGTKITKLEK
jgi:lipid-binding SYLF domain-containing protein